MPPRRRSTRKTSAAAAREPSPAPSEASHHSDPQAGPQPAHGPGKSSDKDKDRCPACSDKVVDSEITDKDIWISCDKCKTWFHWRCLGETGDPEAWSKWCAIVTPPSRLLINAI
ncbi:hypothetical protein M422DRAFT_784040 [Sphaerobolus stellatus SS14]|uniref:Zinc finger PHD-type domain-containing protein n=1 Tax=Sphaerobolus stellatus (strain SS14) TaxID=990650 RepID=A0A0C9U7J2_SPHS4|nr:hypothetical protein M422DRAFT_784040 [Sphaerobolus stellatus SS14]